MTDVSLYLFSLVELIWSCKLSVTPKMVKKVITNLDSSKASGLVCIPVVVLKNWEPELSYILAELFNKCLKESCFSDCWKVSSLVPSSMQYGSIRIFLPHEIFLDLGVLGQFSPKMRQEKLTKILNCIKFLYVELF